MGFSDCISSLDGHVNPLPKLPHNVVTFEAPNVYRRKVKESLESQTSASCSSHSANCNSSKSHRCCTCSRASDLDYFLSCFDDSLGVLSAKGLRPAAVIVDPIFSSNGVLDPPDGYLQVC
jgi:4-aminobutyrate aminotransferase-like enzyme